MNPVDTDRLHRWIANQTGLAAALLDRPSFAQHVRERMAYLGATDEVAYINLLRRQPDELERVVEMVAVPETWLFRYPTSFTFLADHLRVYRAAHVSRQLRLLSVACATGEEAYSMAITAAHSGWPLAQVTVDAVDCQRRAIVQAQQRKYNVRSMRGDLPDWAREWLTIEGEQLRIESAVARTVHFHCDDILKMQLQGAPYDAIFCRNLLIYLNASARQRLIRRLSEWLLPGALLFLGHAERTEYVTEFFERLDVPHAFAWKRRPDETTVARVPRDIVSESSPSRQTMRDDSVLSHVRRSDIVAVPRPVDGEQRTSAELSADEDSATTGSPAYGNVAEPRVVDDTAELDTAVRLADSGDLVAALKQAQLHLLQGTPNVEIYQLLGTLYAALQDYDEAREAFEKVVYLQPNHEEALLQLAMIYRRAGDQDKAARYRRRAARAHRDAQS